MTQTILHDNRDELIDIVDEHDNVLQIMTKDDAYNQKKRLRIASVAVIDPQTGKIAITRRGKGVSWQPLHYAISACGHVGAGEAWEVAAAREMHEEIGVNVPVMFVGKTAYDDEFGKHFVLSAYIAYATPEQIAMNEREVAELFWMTPAEVQALLDKGEMLHNVFPPVIKKILAAL